MRTRTLYPSSIAGAALSGPARTASAAGTFNKVALFFAGLLPISLFCLSCANPEDVDRIESTAAELTLTGTASASSVQKGHEAKYANDNNTGTRWCASSGSFSQWLKIDLGSSKSISGTEIVWEQNAAYVYRIETSPDNSKWTAQVSKTASAQTCTDNFPSAVTARYVRVYVTAAPKNVWASISEFRVNSNPVTDQDGNVYTTVTIGSQVWMVQNLRTTHFRNGDPIPQVTDDQAWGYLYSAGYAFYQNTTDAALRQKFGALYNGYAVADSRNIAPSGWHVPTASEWQTLKNYLGSNAKSFAAKTDWTPSTIAGAPGNNPSTNNSSNFTCLPNGTRHFYGNFNNDLGNSCDVWSSSVDYVNNSATVFQLDHDGSFFIENWDLGWGYSVRLVHD